MGANLSQNDQNILDMDYCGVHGVDNEIEKHDVMRNPDAIQAGRLLDREDPDIVSIYKLF